MDESGIGRDNRTGTESLLRETVQRTAKGSVARSVSQTLVLFGLINKCVTLISRKVYANVVGTKSSSVFGNFLRIIKKQTK